MSQIALKQINTEQLSVFIQQTASGSALSGSLQPYFLASGFLGNHVVYITGDQTIAGIKSFLDSPAVPYSGNTGTAPSTLFVIDSINILKNDLSGFNEIKYVTKDDNDIVSGYKIFTGAVQVGSPTETGHAINFLYLSGVSGALENLINTFSVENAVTTDTTQIISGQKTFTVSPLVPTPTVNSGVVNKAYVDALQLTGVVYTTGNQTVSGTKTFISSPTVPIGVNPTDAVRKSQLDALGTSIGGVTGFAGVLSLNGTSGASGNLYLEGAGTVTINQCGSIFYISGNTANNTQLYSVRLPLPSGVTGVSYSWGTGFVSVPSVVGNLEYTGASTLEFIRHTIYGTNISGFNAAFSSGIPNINYLFNFNAIPFASGLQSGFLGIRGEQGGVGPYLNPRGNWGAGNTYGYLDTVYQINNNASYFSKLVHVSDSFNQPGGTGTAYWQLLATGTRGATGSWVYQGDFTTGTIYQRYYSASYDGSTFGYTGLNPISGVYPDVLISGWTYVARKGDVGSLTVSGNITGVFSTLSFLLEPVGTGEDLAESFVGHTFIATGYALGCVQSGRGPLTAGSGPLSGSIYVRDTGNTKTYLENFVFDSGKIFYYSGGFSHTVTGLYRMGIDVSNSLSGISKFSVGIFGFGGQGI